MQNKANLQHTAKLSQIEMDRIRYPKVRKFLADYQLSKPQDFAKLNALCYDPAGLDYHSHLKTYTFRHPINEVWNAYKTIRPDQVWRGAMVRFGMQYARHDHSITYADDSRYEGLQAGQLIILNLRLLNGIINLAVGHEVMHVCDETKAIRISYLENSASQGSQFITLAPIANGGTQVTHKTLYKSGSWFRDRVLYPGLHTKAIGEFHGNVRKMLEDNVLT
ncbi:MAG: hypothetical protein KF687_07400 [Cyclobacteriaceae bacterium]|nr:hypothetical protein [Cyclobacteriaceae bacterium]